MRCVASAPEGSTRSRSRPAQPLTVVQKDAGGSSGCEVESVSAAKASGASLGMLVGLAAVAGGAYLAREQINEFVAFFIDMVEAHGPMGYLAYAAVYTGMEVLAVPAIPLTMTAGAIFGVVPGTALVSVSATAAATMSFLIARYAARDKVQQIAESNPKWAAVDKAIGKDSFRVVTLLRLSPLMPLAVSNYLYGLTSVELVPYIFGSWLGMLPGTAAYVAAGAYGRELLVGTGDAGESLLSGVPTWQIALGVGATIAAVGYIGSIAKAALAEVAEEEL